MSATLIRKKDAHRLPDPQAVIIYNAVPHSGSATVSRLLYESINSAKSRYGNYYPFVNTNINLTGVHVLSGHGTLGVHHLLSANITAWYFTFLRHPLRCAISNYKHDIDFFHKQFHKEQLHAHLLRWQGWLTRFLGDGDIQRARDTLFTDYAFYGITEHFDESLQRLEALIPEIQGKSYTNVAVSRQKTPDIPSEILEQFYEQNKEDIALYEEALRLFAPTGNVAVRPHTTEYTANSQQVLHSLESSQGKSETIPEELHDAYQTARTLTAQKQYAAALQALDKTRDAPYFLLRIEIYAHMEYHAHVMEMGTAYVRNMHAQDPLGQVPDIRYCIAYTLVFVIKSFRVLYPYLPFPEEYARWLQHCAGTITILPLLEWCCDKRERDADLTWFLKHCPPSAQHSMADRGRAWLLLADRHLRREEYAEARANAQESLRCNPHWPEAWLTLANAELHLGEPCSCMSTLLRMFRIAESCNLFALCDRIILSASANELLPEEWKAVSEYLTPYTLKQYREIADYKQFLPQNLAGKKNLVLYNRAYGAYPGMFDEFFSIPGINRDQCVCATWSENPPSLPTDFEGRFDVHLDSTQPLLATGSFMQCGLPTQYASVISINLLPIWHSDSLSLLTKILTGQPHISIFCGGKTLQTNSSSGQASSVHGASTQPSLAVWGCGGRYRDVIHPQLHNKNCVHKVAYFIDSNARPDQLFECLPVYTPEKAATQPVDAVLVASAFREAIAERAKTAGINNLFWF